MLCVRRVICCKALLSHVPVLDLNGTRNIHTTTAITGIKNPAQQKTLRAHAEYYDDYWSRDLETWSDNNNVLYPPSKPGESYRPAEIYHGRSLIRYSPKKLWYMTKLVMNMNIDDAINYMNFVHTKGAKIIREVLIEAQEIAVKDHNVEFKSNLHVVSSFVLPAGCRKIPAYHARGRSSIVRSRFSNYYLMIREGQGPEWQPNVTAYSAAVSYINKMKMRTIYDGL